MKSLKKYLNRKRKKIPNKSILSFAKNDKKITRDKTKTHFSVLSKDKQIIDRLDKIMLDEGVSLIYQRKIKLYFLKFLNFIDNNNNNKNKTSIFTNTNDNKTLKNYTGKIALSDVFNFVNTYYKKYKEITKNTILSKMRKYIRILNDEPNINYEKKISFKKTNNKSEILCENELIEFVNNLKTNDENEVLMIFYFLYFSGLTFNDISRCLNIHFKKSFSILNIQQNKTKEIKIPSIIQSSLNEISKFKNNNNKFFFYEEFRGNSNQTRTQFIKGSIEGALKKYSNISKNKIKELIKNFSKKRNHKFLNKKFPLLFDINVKCIDDNDIGELLNFKKEENELDSFISNNDQNNSKNENKDEIYINFNSLKNDSFDFEEKKDNDYYDLFFNSNDSIFEERSSTIFLQKKINIS